MAKKAKKAQKAISVMASPKLPPALQKVGGASNILATYFKLQSSEAVRITNKIVYKVKDTLTAKGKGWNAPALAEWRLLLLAAVHQKLIMGGDWAQDGPGVLLVARDMGTIAALLTGQRPTAGVNQLKGAFAACKSHTRCGGGGVGGGAWCTFDWI